MDPLAAAAKLHEALTRIGLDPDPPELLQRWVAAPSGGGIDPVGAALAAARTGAHVRLFQAPDAPGTDEATQRAAYAAGVLWGPLPKDLAGLWETARKGGWVALAFGKEARLSTEGGAPPDAVAVLEVASSWFPPSEAGSTARALPP